MLLDIRQLIAPPVMARDEEHLVARLLHYVLLLTFAANLFFVIALMVLQLSSDLLWVDGVAFVGIGGLLVLVRQHHIRMASWIFSLLLLLMVIAVGFDNNVGLSDLNYGVSMGLVLVVGSVLLGRLGAIVFTGLVIASSVMLYLLVPPPIGVTQDTVLLTLILDSVIFVSIGFFTGYSVSSLNNALTRAQTSEQALVKNNAQLKSEITERERVEKALRESQEHERQLQKRLRALNGVSNDLAKISSTDTLCVMAAELAHLRLGFDRIGMHLVDKNAKMVTATFFSDAQGNVQRRSEPKAIDPILALRFSNNPDQPATAVQVDEDVQLQGQDGQPAVRGWQLISPLRDDKGLIGWISADNFFEQQPYNPHDSEILQLYRITIEHLYSQKRAEEALVEMAVKKQRVELINELVSNLSHDLRTPLTIINTSLYLLQKLEEPEHQREKAKIIEVQSRRLERLINDVLMMSKLEQQDEITMQPMQLNGLIKSLKEGFESTAETRGQSIVLHLEPKLPLILGSRDGLERITSNLLENATSYTPDGGTITVRTYQSAQSVVLEVSDTGVGISKPDQQRIFERFYRADSARSLKSGGTGLGLAITKRLVDMHKAKIEVESTVGKGTVFRICFMPSYSPRPVDFQKVP